MNHSFSCTKVTQRHESQLQLYQGNPMTWITASVVPGYTQHHESHLQLYQGTPTVMNRSFCCTGVHPTSWITASAVLGYTQHHESQLQLYQGISNIMNHSFSCTKVYPTSWITASAVLGYTQHESQLQSYCCARSWVVFPEHHFYGSVSLVIFPWIMLTWGKTPSYLPLNPRGNAITVRGTFYQGELLPSVKKGLQWNVVKWSWMDPSFPLC